MIRTLQLFENYLPNAQNWAFRMLMNMPDTEIFVAAYRYYNNQFAPPQIHRIKLPHFVTPELLEGSDKSLPFYKKLFLKVNRQKLNHKFFDHLAANASELKVDLIHVHFANMGWQFLKIKELTRLPYIVSFYGFDYESLPHTFPVWKKRYKELFEKADHFICEGPFGASILERSGCHPGKIKVINLGVETDKIPFKHRKKNPKELHLLQIANFTEKKGHIYALKAFIEAEKNCPDMTLTFVGRDIELPTNPLSIMVKEHKLENKVKFLSFIVFSELYNFLSNFHVFIHPSCYAKNRDCEGGAPVVILDAEGTGMPVISTMHCDIPQEVVHNVTGLLSPERDVTHLAASIQKFYHMDNDEYQKFAHAARHHVQDKFDCVKNGLQLRNFYGDCIQL